MTDLLSQTCHPIKVDELIKRVRTAASPENDQDFDDDSHIMSKTKRLEQQFEQFYEASSQGGAAAPTMMSDDNETESSDFLSLERTALEAKT